MVSRAIPPDASPGQIKVFKGANSNPFPAPVLGLNTRDGVLNLQQTEARELTNWLPDNGRCLIRKGYSTYATIPGNKTVPLLVRYIKGGTTSLIAASNGNLWSVTASPTSLASGYASDHWSCDYMNGYLFGVNGTDIPWRYDGSTVSATGFTGVTLTTLRTVKCVQNRLWFTVVNSGDVYYSGQLSVTGPLTIFQISQIADGGYCMAVFPWRDKTIFYMSTGQVLVYQGDPAIDITLVTKYYAPPLIEPDAAMKMGGELISLTQSGPISMDVIASGNAFNLEALGAWSKIAPSWQADFQSYGANAGWFGKFIEGLCYFNVPTGTATTKQYVFNTRNEAWTNYTNLPISSIEEYIGTIYFGSSNTDGIISQHTGGLDGGNQIVSTARPGFSYLDAGNVKKTFTAIKPNIFTGYALSGQFQVDTDFSTSLFNAPIVDISAPGSTSPWGQSTPWGSPWATQTSNAPQWIGCTGEGSAVSLAQRTYSSGDDVQWFSSDVMVNMGGPL